MPSSKFTSYIAVTFIILLSVWIRISYINQTWIINPFVGDAYNYVQYAKNIVEHGTFSKDDGDSVPTPDSYWSPGYPSFIATIIFIGHKLNVNDYKLTLYVQAIIGIVTVLLTFFLGRLFLSKNWALLATVLVSLSPHLISMGGYILTETLFTFCLLLAIYVYSKAYISQKRKYYIASGIMFGFSYLVNPVMFFLPIFLFLSAHFISVYKGKKQFFTVKQQFISCLLIFFTVVGAWSIRNSINVPPEKTSSSDRLLINLIIGAHSDYHEIWRANPRDSSNPAVVDKNTVGGSYRDFLNLLAKRIIDDPLHYAKWYIVEKPVLLWSWSILTGQGDIYVYPVKVSLYQQSSIALATHVLMKSIHYFLFGFAFFGIFILFKPSASIPEIPIFLYVTLIYISAIYVITQSEPRYSIPLRPEMYLCAVFFLSEVTKHIKLKIYKTSS